MISGASEGELDVANQIADLLLEIERLNNIIENIEKYLKEQNDEHYSWHYREWIRQVLDKLNELKGDNK